MSCIYIFHTIYPNRQNWQMIMSHKRRCLIFFPGSVHSATITKTLSLFANRYKNSYVPVRNIWLSRLYCDISNSKQKQWLTIDTRDVNDPGKFRTQADNRTRQICYYNKHKTDTSFNSFLATRDQISQKGDIKFSIEKVIANTNSSNVNYSNVSDELIHINNDNNTQLKLQQLSDRNITGRGTTDKNRK